MFTKIRFCIGNKNIEFENFSFPLGEITADPWVVQLVDGDDLEGQIAVGDTFRCGGADGSLFSVQQIISGAGAKLFVCSANERSPL